MFCLNSAKSNLNYNITKVNATGKLFQKLLDMGFVKGATIKVVREAPLCDPMELKIHNYLITLRKSEAELIEVELCKKD